MKIRVNTENMKRALKILSKVSNSGIDGLDILMSAKGNFITLTKKNNDTTVRVDLYGFDTEEGKAILPIGIVGLVQKIKSPELTISDNTIKTKERTINYKVDEIELSTNAALNKGPETKIFSTTVKELLRMLRVKYAAAHNDVRPILQGIFFNGNETVACDGYRFSIRKGCYESDAKFVVNLGTINILESILNTKFDDMQVDVYYDESIEKVKFTVDNTEVIGHIIPGEYFNYKSIIPDESDFIVTINAEKLKEELNLSNTGIAKLYFQPNKLTMIQEQCEEVYDEEASKQATQKLQDEKDKKYKEKYNKWAEKKAQAEKEKKPFNLKCPKEVKAKKQRVLANVVTASIKSELNCVVKHDNNTTDEFNIAFNPKYLDDGIRQYSDEVLLLKMTTPVSPMIICKEDNEDLELVLPVRLLNA